VALQEEETRPIERCLRYIGRFSLQPGPDVLAEILDQIADRSAFGKSTFERALRLARRRRWKSDR